MNKNKQIFRVLALTTPFILSVGNVGATNVAPPVNTDLLAQNTDVQDDDRSDQDVVDSKSGSSQRPNGSNLNEHSLFYALTEYDNLFDLKRSLLSLVDNATERELVEIFHESREYPLAFESLQTTQWLRGIVLSKLIDIDGDTVHSLMEQLDEQTAEVVLYGVMREWNQMYADQAVKFLALLDDGLQRRGLQGVIDGSSSLSRASFIEMGTELGYQEDYLTYLLDRHQLEQDQISLDDIATALESVISKGKYRFHEAQRKAVSFVHEQGLDSLARVLEVFEENSAENMSQTVRMFFGGTQSKLVAAIARSDPEPVFEHLVSLGEPLDVDMLSSVSEVWFATDPEALWNRLRGEDLKDIQEEVTEDVIRHWTMREPDFALVSLDQFPTEYHDLVYAEVALEVAPDSPLEALELLTKTSDWSQTMSDREQSENETARNVGFYFSIDRTIAAATKADPVAAIEWIESSVSHLDDSMKQHFLDKAYQSWAGSDPHTAFEMAQQIPLAGDTAGFEATVVGWVAKSDVDEAIKLLPRVREGTTKMRAYRRVMWRLEEQDRISHALHLGSDLPQHQREEYNDSLAWQIGYREPFDHLIAGIRALPSQELQSRAIYSRLSFTYYLPEMAPKITNKQLDQFKEFLTDREKRLLEMGRRMFKDRIHEDSSED
ncbi:MAG: hypothetical protein OXH31_09990 [Gammaproteobacteria bacterium]|nr:hypothetical protein [Gammaproteobacteria bacterium]